MLTAFLKRLLYTCRVSGLNLTARRRANRSAKSSASIWWRLVASHASPSTAVSTSLHAARRPPAVLLGIRPFSAAWFQKSTRSLPVASIYCSPLMGLIAHIEQMMRRRNQPCQAPLSSVRSIPLMTPLDRQLLSSSPELDDLDCVGHQDRLFQIRR